MYARDIGFRVCAYSASIFTRLAFISWLSLKQNAIGDEYVRLLTFCYVGVLCAVIMFTSDSNSLSRWWKIYHHPLPMLGLFLVLIDNKFFYIPLIFDVLVSFILFIYYVPYKAGLLC